MFISNVFPIHVQCYARFNINCTQAVDSKTKTVFSFVISRATSSFCGHLIGSPHSIGLCAKWKMCWTLSFYWWKYIDKQLSIFSVNTHALFEFFPKYYLFCWFSVAFASVHLSIFTNINPIWMIVYHFRYFFSLLL